MMINYHWVDVDVFLCMWLHIQALGDVVDFLTRDDAAHVGLTGIDFFYNRS